MEESDLTKFIDAYSISEYAIPAVAWANSVGLINGVSDNELDPLGEASRVQVANIIYRFCKCVADMN